MLRILAVAAILFAVIVVGRFVVVWLRLMRMRFSPGDVEAADRAAMPADVATILDPAKARLAALGFEYEETRLIYSMVRKSDPTSAWADIYVHPASGSRASVQVSDAPEPGMVATVSFVTYHADKIIETASRRMHLMFPMPANYDIEDAGAATLAEHWDYHYRRIVTAPGSVVSDGQELRRRYRQMRAGLFEYWRQSGFMRRKGDDWRLTGGGAWRYLRRVMAGNRCLAKLPPHAELEDLHLRVLADSLAWRSQEALLKDTSMSRRGKVLWFAVSALAGAAAFGYMISWQMVPIILGVLLFHEFGHALAMRAVGYSALTVLVLPFLGAVVIGRKDDAGPWQKLAVLLAGPLPGLILATACLRLALGAPTQHELLITIGSMALAINLFNLLPLTPLDGGQIVDTFLFSRRPRLRFTFFAASTVALVVVAMALKSTVLAAAGLILALTIPGSGRRLRLVAGMMSTFDPAEPEVSLFKRLHEPQGSRLPSFTQRIQTVQTLLPLLRGRAPTALESAVGLVAYLATIALPVALLWDTGLPRQAFAELLGSSAATSRQTPTPPDWRGQLARATTPEERWQVVWDAGQWFEDMEDQQQARERYQESLAEAAQMPASPQSDVHLLDSRIALIRLSETDAAPAYAALLPVLRALPALERWRLADVLEALNSLESRAQADVRIARLREALQARQDADSPDAFRLTEDRVELARLIDADGDADGAEALLRSNLADTTNRPSAIAVRQLEPLAWFLMAHGRAAEAESLLAARSSSTPASQAVRQALAWSCLLQGKTAVARELLQEELAALKTQKSSAWQRLSITLDLIHASADVSQESARWIAEASELRVTASQQLRGFRAFLAHEAENKDWENVRGPARLAALQRLPATADELADNRGGVK